jgi:hypothetical protein
MLFNDLLVPSSRPALFPASDRVSFSNVTIKNYLADIKIDFSFLFKDQIRITQMQQFLPTNPVKSKDGKPLQTPVAPGIIFWRPNYINTGEPTNVFREDYSPSLVFQITAPSGYVRKTTRNNFAKFYKIKIFQIDKFLSNILNDNPNQLVQDIEKIIQERNLDFYDFSLRTGFEGDIDNPEMHLEESEILSPGNKAAPNFFTLNLNYKNSLIIRRQKNIEDSGEFLSLGAIFYIDLPEYIREQKPSVEFIENNKILFNSNVTILNIFDSEGNLLSDDSNASKIFDLRKNKRIFNKNDELNQLYEKSLFDPKKIFETIDSRNKKASLANNTNIFSDLFSARSWNYLRSPSVAQELSLLFFADYRKLFLENNSFIYKPTTKDILIDSLRILRRQCLYNEKTKKIEKIVGDPFLIIETSGKPKQLPTKASNIGAIKENNELRYLDNEGQDFIAIEVQDKNLYSLKNGKYQYGVQLILSDSFFSFLQARKTSLLEKETILDTLKLDCQNKYNYSVFSGVFSSLYLEEFENKLFKENKTKSQIIAELISEFIDTLKILNLTQDGTDTVSLINNLLNPRFSSLETIEYFSQIYRNFILRIGEVIKERSPKHSITIEKWFPEVFDASHSDAGYIYYSRANQNFDGFLRKDLDITALKTQALSQLGELYSTSNTFTQEDSPNSYRYIGPKILQLPGIEPFFFTYSTNEKFIHTEAKIRAYKNSKTYNEENILVENENANASIFSSKILENSSIVIKNLFQNLPQEQLLSQNGSIINTSVNNNIDTSILSGIIKSKIANKTIKQKYDLSDFFYTKITLSGAEQQTNIYSFQIKDLINNGGRFFKGENLNYLTDLRINSRFLLMYQTLMEVQILTRFIETPNKVKTNDTSNIKNLRQPLWEPLTTTIVANLPKSKYLCRLVRSNDDTRFFDKREEIMLPVFDEHFILTVN